MIGMGLTLFLCIYSYHIVQNVSELYADWITSSKHTTNCKFYFPPVFWICDVGIVGGVSGKDHLRRPQSVI